jgi:hypothetical protein
LVDPSKPSQSESSSGFLIATACLLLLLSFGYRAGFGLFVKPITEANGWGREIISIALAIQNLFWGTRSAASSVSGWGAGCMIVAAATMGSGAWVWRWV